MCPPQNEGRALVEQGLTTFIPLLKARTGQELTMCVGFDVFAATAKLVVGRRVIWSTDVSL
jgi:hypothetical protein